MGAAGTSDERCPAARDASTAVPGRAGSTLVGVPARRRVRRSRVKRRQDFGVIARPRLSPDRRLALTRLTQFWQGVPELARNEA